MGTNLTVTRCEKNEQVFCVATKQQEDFTGFAKCRKMCAVKSEKKNRLFLKLFCVVTARCSTADPIKKPIKLFSIPNTSQKVFFFVVTRLFLRVYLQFANSFFLFFSYSYFSFAPCRKIEISRRKLQDNLQKFHKVF